MYASVYMPYESSEVPNRKLVELQNYCQNNQIPLIVGIDCNAQSELSGSTNTNERGQKLMEFIIGSNLSVINKGHEPTFVISNRREVLDITLVSDNFNEKIIY